MGTGTPAHVPESGYERVMAAARTTAVRPLVARPSRARHRPRRPLELYDGGACVEQCPVDIEHVDHILDMRRYQVLDRVRVPQRAGVMLRNLENKGNPVGNEHSSRTVL